MELTPEQPATNGTLLYALPNIGYPRSYMTGIQEAICASNKQVFLEAVLRVKKIKAERYITCERNYYLWFSWFVLYIYFKHKN